jgi:hypothetical protein
MKTWKKPAIKTIAAEELEKIILASACSNYFSRCIMWICSTDPEIM